MDVYIYGTLWDMGDRLKLMTILTALEDFRSPTVGFVQSTTWNYLPGNLTSISLNLILRLK